jgi:hypothetical protein
MTRSRLAMLFAAILGLTPRASAHHPFDGEFDQSSR